MLGERFENNHTPQKTVGTCSQLLYVEAWGEFSSLHSGRAGSRLIDSLSPSGFVVLATPSGMTSESLWSATVCSSPV